MAIRSVLGKMGRRSCIHCSTSRGQGVDCPFLLPPTFRPVKVPPAVSRILTYVPVAVEDFNMLQGQRSQSSLGGFPVLQQCGAAGKMEISGSYISPYFITDQMSLTCDFKMPLIISFSGVIKDGECDLLEAAICEVKKAESKKPLLLVARDVDDKVLSWLILENSEINVCVVASPTNLDELAVFAGGELVTTHSKFSPKVFGRAKRVIVTYEKMAIFGGHLPR